MKNQQGPIVVQGAMSVETQHIIDQMTEVREEPFGPFRCARGVFEGHGLVVCETQWGMANASALAALAIARYHPQAIISQGTAGAHDASLSVYDIVLGARTANSSAWQTYYRAAGAGVDYRGLKQLGVFAWNKDRKEFLQEVYHEGNPTLLAAARRAAARTNMAG